VNPIGPAPEHEKVMLLNASPEPVDLTGWAVADRLKNKVPVRSGMVAPGATLVVDLPSAVQLGNDGGVITLLDRKGLKVDGVSYTKQQGRREGWTTVF
jgi:lamin tail-like protein